MESAPTNDDNSKDVAKKFLEFTDDRGMKTEVAVFESESDEEALARARAIDAGLGEKSHF